MDKTFLAPLALSLGLSCSGTPSKELEPRSAAKPTVVQEITEKTLGNMRFVLEAPETIPQKDRQSFFKNLETAYGDLSDFLGSEVMQSPDGQTVYVVIGEDQPRGLIQWHTTMSNFADGVPRELSINSVTFYLSDLRKANIAHELVHLYAQAPFFGSEAFHEGTAHAIERSVYQGNPSMMGMRPLLNASSARPLLSKGWDYTPLDAAQNGGIQDRTLKNFIVLNWEEAFLRFERSHNLRHSRRLEESP